MKVTFIPQSSHVSMNHRCGRGEPDASLCNGIRPVCALLAAILRTCILALAIGSVSWSSSGQEKFFRAGLVQGQPGGASLFGGASYFRMGTNTGEFIVAVVDPFSSDDFTAFLEAPAGSVTFPLGIGEPRIYSGCNPFGNNPFLPSPPPPPITCPAFMSGMHYTGSFTSSPALLENLLAGHGEFRLVSNSGVVLRGQVVPEENRPPVVSVTSPQEGQVIRGTYVILRVNASDPDGRVVKVEYFNGTNSIGTAYGDWSQLHQPIVTGGLILDVSFLSGFGFFWVTGPGEYEITARATDDSGATTISVPVHFSVVGPPIVNVQATDAQASERGSDPGVFTITRSGSTAESLYVNYWVNGSASNGVDYRAISNWVVIPAGQDSVQIVIDPLDDLEPDGRETVRLQLYYPFQLYALAVYPPPSPSYIVGTNSRAVVYIADDDGGPTNHPPLVRLVDPMDGQTLRESPIYPLADASDPDGSVVLLEYFAGTKRIGSVTNPPDSSIIVPWLVLITYNSGQDTAVPAQIYGPLPGVAAGPRWDPVPGEYDLTVRATDNDGAVTTSDPVHVTIVEKTIVTIRATDAHAAEPGRDSGLHHGVFTIARSGSTVSNLQVNYSIGGTAVNGEDYEEIHDSVVIPAGRKSVQIVITPLPDRLEEGTETVSLQLMPDYIFDPVPLPSPIGWPLDGLSNQGSPASAILSAASAYEVGASSQATVFIRDNNSGPKNYLPSVKITQPKNGQVFSRESDILISTDTVDRDGYVEKVEFFDGVQKIGETVINFLVPPAAGSHVTYDFEWTDMTLGLHTLRARATDTNGGRQLSAPVRIWVQ